MILVDSGSESIAFQMVHPFSFPPWPFNCALEDRLHSLSEMPLDQFRMLDYEEVLLETLPIEVAEGAKCQGAWHAAGLCVLQD